MIYLASDHAGFKLKVKAKKYLTKQNIAFIDLGTESESPVDYPTYAGVLAKNVLDNNAMGILICGTGIGMSIAVNRYHNIRGALCYSSKMACFARQHNDANVLVLPGRNRLVAFRLKRIIKTFLNTEFEGGRHKHRIDMIEQVQK